MRVEWTAEWAALIFGVLIGAFAEPVLVAAFGDFWAVVIGAVAFLALVFAVGSAADYFYED